MSAVNDEDDERECCSNRQYLNEAFRSSCAHALFPKMNSPMPASTIAIDPRK